MSLILPRRRVHIRCSREKCKRRYTLPKHPDEYVRGWKCAGCSESCEVYETEELEGADLA